MPYRGIAPAVPDVVAGRVGFIMAASNSVGELLKSGALRALAISSDKRSPQFPEVPTFKEQGYPELQIREIFGFFASSRAGRYGSDC